MTLTHTARDLGFSGLAIASLLALIFIAAGFEHVGSWRATVAEPAPIGAVSTARGLRTDAAPAAPIAADQVVVARVRN